MKFKIFAVLLVVFLLTIGAVGTGFAQEETPEPEEVEEISPVCAGDMTHPALTRIANIFDVEYDELVTWFCDYNFGIGEIGLALVTAQRLDNNNENELTYEDILMWRLEGQNGNDDNGDEEENGKKVGWGIIWQELGLIGNRRNNDTENGEETNGEELNGEDINGNGNGNNGGNGPSENPGRPDNPGNKPDGPPGLQNGHPGQGRGRGK